MATGIQESGITPVEALHWLCVFGDWLIALFGDWLIFISSSHKRDYGRRFGRNAATVGGLESGLDRGLGPG